MRPFFFLNTSDDEFVDDLYQALLNRVADIAGKNFWLEVLNRGGSREDVLNGFVLSNEFGDLTANLGIIACAQ